MGRHNACTTWELRDDGWQLVWPGQAPVVLSASERLLLLEFSRHEGVVLSRQVLAAALAPVHHRNPGRCYDDRRVNMLISRIRAKARQIGAELPLKSVPSRGYMLTPQAIKQNPHSA